MAHSRTTFEAYGRSLGLTEEHVLEALVVAIRDAGPGVGGRFVGSHHVVDDDRTYALAL